MEMVERGTADRLILVNVVDHHFYLEEPTFIGAGQSYWIDREAGEICVDRGGGRLTRHGQVKQRADWMRR
ncbi:hypothetical protein [Actinoplanes sp. NPDC051851]|uniref:hypothetical protein n=1 Tax=Actinoplanes sp. NPDC051851 TaxID=3154753 RepID=UPI003435642E